MGSVKDIIMEGPLAEKWYKPVTASDFGRAAWDVKGTFSVLDLKGLIPETEVEHKAAAVAMTNARMLERLADSHPEIKTCFLGLLDKDGNVVDTQKLLDRGET